MRRCQRMSTDADPPSQPKQLRRALLPHRVRDRWIAAAVAITIVCGLLYGGDVLYDALTSSTHPQVGLIWSSDVDPTIVPGVTAPEWQFLIRTDNHTLYYKSGPASTNWTVLGGGGGGGTVTSISCNDGLTCTPDPITGTGTIGMTSSACPGSEVATGFSAGVIQCTPASTGTVTGTGTTNDLTKFTNGAGGVIGNSSASDDGTTFAINTNKVAITESTGVLTLADASIASTPSSSFLRMQATQLGGREMLTAISTSGNPQYLQTVLGARALGMWEALPGGTTVNNFGIQPLTAQGTPTLRSLANTNYVTATKRVGYVSSASGGNTGGARNTTTTPVWRGNASGLGGFFVMFRFNISDAALVGTGRTFVGLEASTSAPTDVDPTTLTNIFGICQDNGDANFAICAAGAVAQAEATLGASFPANTTSTDEYQLVIYATPDAAAISWQVTRLNTGDTVSGVQSTAANLFDNGTFMVPQFWRGNGGTASAVGIDVAKYYQETP